MWLEPDFVCRPGGTPLECAVGAAASFYPHCLTLEPALTEDETATDDPDFERVSDQFPTQPERAIPLALAIDLFSSLATNRAAIDLERRRHQLEQLRY